MFRLTALRAIVKKPPRMPSKLRKLCLMPEPKWMPKQTCMEGERQLWGWWGRVFILSEPEFRIRLCKSYLTTGQRSITQKVLEMKVVRSWDVLRMDAVKRLFISPNAELV